MQIGKKLRQIRESQNLTQEHIQKRTGLRRAYTSRVENGHTLPSVATLEKYASALKIPLYRLFCEGNNHPILKPKLTSTNKDGVLRGTDGTEFRELRLFAKLLSCMTEADRKLLLAIAAQLAQRTR